MNTMLELSTTPRSRRIESTTTSRQRESHVSEWEAGGLMLGCDGEVLLSGPAEALFRAWKALLERTLSPYYDLAYAAPTFINRETLDATHYMDHFPQHMIHGCARGGAKDLCLTPAACFHTYPLVGRSAKPFAALVTAPCARYEEGAWDPPFRLACFHMTELVVVGSKNFVALTCAEVLAHLGRLFADLGLPGGFEPAVDAFFLASGRGARLLQQLKELKKEFQMPFETGPVALASVNQHEDYFGRCFDLHDDAGEPAHSFCAAFGLERLTAAGLLTWGSSPEKWPEALQS